MMGIDIGTDSTSRNPFSNPAGNFGLNLTRLRWAGSVADGRAAYEMPTMPARLQRRSEVLRKLRYAPCENCANCGTTLSATARFCPQCGQPAATPTSPVGRFSSPENYTPRHLAEKILTSKGALEGERKQVPVLFADLKGSMELLTDRDPEEARKLLDAVIERMMEAVHRYEGTVNQVMGDGIMASSARPRP
jgi:hypothetical protein